MELKEGKIIGSNEQEEIFLEQASKLGGEAIEAYHYQGHWREPGRQWFLERYEVDIHETLPEWIDDYLNNNLLIGLYLQRTESEWHRDLYQQDDREKSKLAFDEALSLLDRSDEQPFNQKEAEREARDQIVSAILRPSVSRPDYSDLSRRD
jgi:hypothetical protein